MDASPEASARAFLSTYGSLFGIEDQAGELQLQHVRNGDRGRSSVRFQQQHRGVPVLAGELVVNLDQDRNVLSTNGEARPGLALEVNPVIDRADAAGNALEAMATAHRLDTSDLVASDPELWIYDPDLLGAPGRRVPQLVWRMDVTARQGEDVRELVLVDAQTGGIALHFDQLAHAKVRQVCDRNNVPGAPEACTTPFTRSEGGVATGIADVDNAYDYSGLAYDYYQSNFGRDSIDTAGMALKSTVRYCPNSSNCPYPNAYWNGSQLVYGEGWASADDVVGHEFTHGVTDFESNLWYYHQSGAINESLSDVFSELIDLTNGVGNDSPGVRWLIGEDLTIGAIRNMANPPGFGHPDSLLSALYYVGYDDNGGVHSNSGVNNKAAVLMADGGTFRGVTIAPLGISKTGHIYYEAQTNLLTSASDYNDLFEVLQQACLNKVGTAGITNANCNEVKKAVTVTQMNQNPYGPTLVEAPLCDSGDTPTDLFFDNLENPASGNWAITTPDGPGWIYPASGYATSGSIEMLVNAKGETADTAIARTSDLAVPAGTITYLRFNHAFEYEWQYDGGVVEYSTDGGTTWLDAGSLFTDNGYDSDISSLADSSLAGRGVFTGTSFGYYSSRIDLSSLAGSSVRFRFRSATDSADTTLDSLGWSGWVLDDVRAYTCGETPPKISVNDVTVAEGHAGTAPATFTVSRSGSTARSSTVKYATAAGTATAGTDFTGVATTNLSFAAGETTKTVSVNVNGDITAEPNETFFLNLSAPTGATVSDTQGVATIATDDSGPVISVSDVTAAEGDSGTKVASFTITRSGNTSGASTVKWQTAASTATASTDFVSVPLTTVSFGAGETSKPAAVTVNGDTVPEAHETFLVNLSAPTGAVLADSQGIGTITNDDAGVPARLSISDVVVNEGNTGATTASFTITRSGTTAEAVSVQYATAVSTAGAGDFGAIAATTVNLAAGVTSQAVSVNVTGDMVDEANETFLVDLFAPSGATVQDSQGVGTIVDDDGPVTPGPSTFLAVNDVTADEGNLGFSDLSFTITRSGTTTGAASVQYRTVAASASAGTDFVNLPSTTVTFASGETTKTVIVQVYGDAVPEDHEKLTLQLASPTGAVITDGSGLGVITNEDAGQPATLAIGNVDTGEGNSGITSATFRVVRSGDTSQLAAVSYAMGSGGSASSGSDYLPLDSATLSFAAGETVKTLTVAVLPDASVEANETFSLKLSSPVDAVIADDAGLATIFNDDALPSLAINDLTLTEGNFGTRTATFTVSRTGDTARSSTFQWATANGTATAGTDYVAVGATTISFAPGETAKVLTVSIKPDSVAEPNETLLVNLSSPSGARIRDTQGVLTIRNDD